MKLLYFVARLLMVLFCLQQCVGDFWIDASCNGEYERVLVESLDDIRVNLIPAAVGFLDAFIDGRGDISYHGELFEIIFGGPVDVQLARHLREIYMRAHRTVEQRGHQIDINTRQSQLRIFCDQSRYVRNSATDSRLRDTVNVDQYDGVSAVLPRTRLPCGPLVIAALMKRNNWPWAPRIIQICPNILQQVASGPPISMRLYRTLGVARQPAIRIDRIAGGFEYTLFHEMLHAVEVYHGCFGHSSGEGNLWTGVRHIATRPFGGAFERQECAANNADTLIYFAIAARAREYSYKVTEGGEFVPLVSRAPDLTSLNSLNWEWDDPSAWPYIM